MLPVCVQDKPFRARHNNQYCHSTQCLAASGMRKQMSCKNITSSQFALAALDVNKSFQAPALANLLCSHEEGTLPSLRTIRRALLTMKQPSSLFDEKSFADLDYQAIPSACQAFEAKNPGSVAVCETNDAHMSKIFDMCCEDGDRTTSQRKLTTSLLKLGYNEQDIQSMYKKMPIDDREDAQAISKGVFMEHFGLKFRRFAIILKAQVLRCVRYHAHKSSVYEQYRGRKALYIVC